MASISVSTARQTLPAQLDRVQAGEEVAITRHGRVVAVLVHPDALAARRAPEAWADAEAIGARLESARREPLGRPAIVRERAEALVDAVREGRAGG
ncbi:type II toxin-antitoxin system Phd/YefM family antitoxin [Ornithinimicrobium sp. F0845]|uniref:type II toxin-antitoxin system Phd/YefM family antitoxin n=1 Tax=Ornithinimicrobium sp. F0845 TaxID=2926412 RepID=UPI001FF3807C|nr:type II toxin-antitoxin system Phd/YefM family antitoxin [Ornithinimicrobium sp. F0845]MCK0113359.1 type II toxin-antitoxin system Phd/YefM family antitoxin [Ornithinimicrobium sp. F0845]